MPNAVHARRLELGLSRARLARAAGLGINTVWRVESGRVAPQRSTRMLLAHALACDLADLFDEYSSTSRAPDPTRAPRKTGEDAPDNGQRA